MPATAITPCHWPVNSDAAASAAGAVTGVATASLAGAATGVGAWIG